MIKESELVLDEQSGSGTEKNFSEILSVYLKQWIWFLLSVIVFLTVGYLYVKSQIPVYKIQADILIKDNTQSTESDILTQLNVNPANIIIDNEIQVLKSSMIAERTVSTLGLQTSYFSKGNFSKQILYENIPVKAELLKSSAGGYGTEWSLRLQHNGVLLFNGKSVPLNKPVLTSAGLVIFKSTGKRNFDQLYVVFSSITATAQSYSGRLAVSPISKLGSVLTISTEDAVPQRGKDYLNQLVEEYDKASVEYKNKNISNTLSFIEDRLKTLVVELNSSEEVVENYKSANSITDLSTQASIFLNNVSGIDAQITKGSLQLAVLSNIENYLKTPEGSEVKLPSLLGMEDPTVASLVQQLGDAQLRRISSLRTIPESNPAVAAIDDQISILKKSLNQTIQNVKSSILQSQSQLKIQSRRYDSSVKGIPSKERGLLDVMRQQSIKNTLFNFLLQKREETAMSLASTISDSRILNSARSSSVPIKPVKSSLYLIFLVLGLVIPAGIIYLKESLNRKIRKRSDIEGLTPIPILANVSRSNDTDHLIVESRPRSLVAEQIRTLRTNLDYLSSGLAQKVMLFTSSISGEGKSYITLNLGASLASTNKKAIILELDLRKPKLLSTLGLKDSVGLSEYLIGKAQLDEIVREIPRQENLFLIGSGKIPPNPAELLVNGRLGELIEQLKKEYDFILLDAPPVGLVTDARIISRYADITLFIVRYNYTLKDHLRVVHEIYQKGIFKNLSIIYNSVEESSHGYGYTYNYGYYEDEEPKKKTWFRKDSKS